MSMLHPSYKEMISKMNDAATEEDKEITSRYSLVIAAAKRARQINSGSEPLVTTKEKEKNLSIAVDELYNGKVHILDDEILYRDLPEGENTDLVFDEEAPEEAQEAEE